ncbi:hypothetical protein P280DRAFT_424531 [Massarina eburnea CBS 473.64]|uniref:Multicopper oxidase n=1 Tax=Massarina eburnea CBS 473.64 TaxID=1395130 RepID=A0A6A6S5C4_9PLEO|nr:hypothetical protein P280DRAFT_424531 [Massarina eburnea CBS 473.64]
MDIKWPVTGKTVKYNFEISSMALAPDGVPRPMTVVNGQYPGPTIFADWGDMIEVTVTNKLTSNGTGIHWHGFRQLGTNDMDGVGGITECPIPTGGSKTYLFKATQYGTSWYHSHYSVQYGDGLLGPIIINGPASANYDLDLGAMPFTDWFHTPIFEVNHGALHANAPPTADNLLVNGTMTSASGGNYSVTTLAPGKTHRLRFINTGINNWNHVSLDGHPMTVIAADFVPIVPYTTNSLSISVGQRYDVIINANQTVGNYWLRVGTGGGKCDGPNKNMDNVKAIFRYEGAPDAQPDSVATQPLPQGCFDETNIIPFVGTQVPRDMPEQMTLSFAAASPATGNLVRWLVDGSAMMVDFDRPTLQQISKNNGTFNRTENVIQVGESAKFQYWVIQQSQTNLAKLPHSIHLHGHDFYVLDQAENATWSGDLTRLKTDNPIRRDTATLPASGYLVLAFESDNPGVWLMHCHVPFHISAGFGVQFAERSSEIVYTIGKAKLDVVRKQCDVWSTFQKKEFPNGFTQGDSLLRRG